MDCLCKFEVAILRAGNKVDGKQLRKDVEPLIFLKVTNHSKNPINLISLYIHFKVDSIAPCKAISDYKFTDEPYEYLPVCIEVGDCRSFPLVMIDPIKAETEKQSSVNHISPKQLYIGKPNIWLIDEDAKIYQVPRHVISE